MLLMAKAVQGPIPACAGQPDDCYIRRVFAGAYPRVCGATINGPQINALSTGLSPRVRGNLRRAVFLDCDVGPIPACAGQPARERAAGRTYRAYPRVCGATHRMFVRPILDWGLSPRVRGNRNLDDGRHAPFGPIPACAGQPLRPGARRSEHGAYPRVCGATLHWRLFVMLFLGLSPRVRGNRLW